jgi:hypothetical protein
MIFQVSLYEVPKEKEPNRMNNFSREAKRNTAIALLESTSHLS